MVGRTAGKIQPLAERFAGDERGATAIEYALIASFIFLAIVTSVGLIAPELDATFTKVSGNLK